MITDIDKNLMRDLLIDAALEEAEQKGETKYSPSDRFKLTLNKNLKDHGIDPVYPFMSVKRRRAMAIIAAVVATIALSMSVSAVRERVVKFFVEMFDTFAVITSIKEPEYHDKIYEYYAPAYIPDGYTAYEEEKNNFNSKIKWKSERSEIEYNQYIKDFVANIDIEEIFKKVDVFDMEDGLIWGKDGEISIYFESSGYCFVISVHGNINEDELIKIAKSIEKAEFTKS